MRNRTSDREAFQTQFGAKAISCYPDRRLLRRYALPAPSPLPPKKITKRECLLAGNFDYHSQEYCYTVQPFRMTHSLTPQPVIWVPIIIYHVLVFFSFIPFLPRARVKSLLWKTYGTC